MHGQKFFMILVGCGDAVLDPLGAVHLAAVAHRLAAAGAVDQDAAHRLGGGGEDYELLFTAPQSAEAEELGSKIGDIIDGAGIQVIDETGLAIELARTGFRHFS